MAIGGLSYGSWLSLALAREMHESIPAVIMLDSSETFVRMDGGKPILYKDPQAFAAAAEITLPHAEIVIVPGTGHSLNVEKREQVNDRMLRFLIQAGLYGRRIQRRGVAG